jgi:regulatory protein
MGKITKIEIQKRNKERVNLFLDGEYAFSISAELVYKMQGICFKNY